MTSPAASAGEGWLNEMETIALEAIERSDAPMLQAAGQDLLREVQQVREAADSGDPYAAVYFMSKAEESINEIALTDGIPEAERIGLGGLFYDVGSLRQIIRKGLRQRNRTRAGISARTKRRGGAPQMLEAFKNQLKSREDMTHTAAAERTGEQFGVTGRQVQKILRTEYEIDARWSKAFKRGEVE